MSTQKRLYRSQTDRMVSGVCAGIAEYFEIDPTLVRLGLVLLVFLTGGTFGLVLPLIYVAMAVVIPEAPKTGSAKIVDTTAIPAQTDAIDAPIIADAE